MSSTSTPVEAVAPVVPGPSLGARTLRVFARPFQAWEGLEQRSQWWFPVVVACLFQAALTLALYDQVMVPTAMESLRPKIEAGQISEAQAEAIIASPVTRAVNLGIMTVTGVVVPLAVALGLWFAVGFVLGRTFSYRLALEVASWSMLVTLPAVALKMGLAAWQQVPVNLVHTGLGAVIPMSDPPEKLQQSLAVLLDVVGPFSIWLLVVQVAGCAALSGAPRRNVAWVLAALYVVVTVLTAITTYLVTQGA